jgi:hypothetical protein
MTIPKKQTVADLADGYMSLRTLAVYAGLSVRRLRDLLVHPSTPLPHYRIGGKILVRRSEYDMWTMQFRTVSASAESNILESIFREL